MLAAIEPDVVLRPRPFGAHMRGRWRYGLLYVPAAVFGLARQPPLHALAIAAGGLGLSGIMLAASMRLRLALSDGTIRRTSWWGRTVACPAAAVTSVVQVTAEISWTGPPETWLLFLDADGRTVMRAIVSSYPPDEVQRFLRALDRPTTALPGVLKVGEVRREFPRSFHWPWAHYLLTVFLLMTGGIFLAIVAAGIVIAILDSIG
jgi:hypothetical protein